MGVASGCGEQEVGVASGSGWNLWVWLLGVVLRRYIDFLILQQHPYFFVHFFNVFRSCIYINQKCCTPVKKIYKYIYRYIIYNIYIYNICMHRPLFRSRVPPRYMQT